MAVDAQVIAAADPGTIACPRCGLPVRGDQDWCLSCGTAARTLLVPTPAWRAPVAVVAVVAVLGVLLLTWAFVALTRDEDPAPASQPAAPATQPAAAATQPTAPASQPAAPASQPAAPAAPAQNVFQN